MNIHIYKQSKEIEFIINTPYEKFNMSNTTCNLERLEISIMLKIVEFEITNIDFLKELTNRFLNNIELWLHQYSAMFCSQYMKSISKYFLNIKTNSAKYVYNRLIQLANHWFDETLIVEVLGSLCIDFENKESQ